MGVGGFALRLGRVVTCSNRGFLRGIFAEAHVHLGVLIQELTLMKFGLNEDIGTYPCIVVGRVAGIKCMVTMAHA